LKNTELGIRPSGSLYCFAQDNSDKLALRSAQIFNDNVSAGIFNLAASKSTESSPSLSYWRTIASNYLNLRCHQPRTTVCQPLTTPQEETVSELLLAAPPMHGAEYLGADSIRSQWQNLDQWLCAQVNQTYNGQLADFLQTKAPHWHQVGRVCFHLAENKSDPDYPFAFMATYATQITSGGQIRFKPLAQALSEYAGEKNKDALIQLLSPIDLAAKRSAQVQSQLTSGEIYHPHAWTANEAYEFIQEAPLYEESGIIVRLPDWWKKRARPSVSVTIGSNIQHKLGANSLLDFEVQAVLGDQPLTRHEWQTLLESNENLVFFKGHWVEVDREKLNQALDHWKTMEKHVKQDGISFAQGMRLLAGLPEEIGSDDTIIGAHQWSFINAGEELKNLLQQMRSPDNFNKLIPGKTLNATLRPYQSIGVNWLSQLSQLGLGACLADDMGLGKTIQVIAALLIQVEKQATPPSLLILPASLINNWKSEVDRFAPSLRCHFVHSAFLTAKQMSDAQQLEGKHLVITTYGMLSRQKWLLEQSWQLVILDEAQAIKNAHTKQAKTVKQLKSQARIALTGTPVENNLGDLWSLFDFLCPGLLGNASAFKRYVKSLEGKENQYAPLRSLVSPYILRRLKSDKSIIADLPDKTEMHAYCGLSNRQAALYETSIRQLKRSLEEQSENAESGMKRRGLVLSYLLRFKQICNHPSQWLGDDEFNPEASGKFIRLAELAKEISARQEKVLIFTQFRQMTDVLANYLQTIFGQPGLILHGGTSITKRKEFVDAFQREEGPPFFVLSIKAGGTGLNLTAAAHVIHFDRWWNPAVENQATDRAYRIGQKRNVLVHKFVCKGTVEEKIDAMIEEKSNLTKELLGDGSVAEKRLTELDDEELIKLVSLDLNQMP
jgi:SNF2 family DNA or RNA helicase